MCKLHQWLSSFNGQHHWHGSGHDENDLVNSPTKVSSFQGSLETIQDRVLAEATCYQRRPAVGSLTNWKEDQQSCRASSEPFATCYGTPVFNKWSVLVSRERWVYKLKTVAF